MVGIVFALLALMHRAERVSGTNFANPEIYAVTLEKGQRLCARRLFVPEDTAAVVLQIGTYGRPGPRTELVFDAPAGYASNRRSGFRDRSAWTAAASGYQDNGQIRFPVPLTSRASFGGICLVAERRVAFAGEYPSSATRWLGRTFLDGKRINAQITIRFMRPGRERTVELVPTLIHRASLFRPSFLGPWFFWLLPLVWVGLGYGVYRVFVRAGR